MKTLVECLTFESKDAVAQQLVDALLGKSDMLTGYSATTCMADFKDTNDNREVRTLSLLLYKGDNEKKPEYILCLWGGRDYGGLGLLDDIKKEITGDTHKLKYEVSKSTNNIQIHYDNAWWSLKVFTEGEYKNLYIEK